MLRVVLAISLLTVVLGNAFLQTIVLLDFKINQDLIIETLCVQKEAENNTCKGTCHLGKQLEKTEKQSEKTPVLPEEHQETLVFYASNSISTFSDTLQESVFIPSSSTLFPVEIQEGIFHPPQLV